MAQLKDTNIDGKLNVASNATIAGDATITGILYVEDAELETLYQSLTEI